MLTKANDLYRRVFQVRAQSMLLVASTLLGCGLACAQQTTLQPQVSPFTGRTLLETAPLIHAEQNSPDLTQQNVLLPLNTIQPPNFPGFASTPRYNAGVTSDLTGDYVVVEGEFDGKSGVDVAAVQGDGVVNLLLNDGKGNFTPVYGAPVPYFNASSGDAGDLNGDGLSDLVVANSATAIVNVYLNQGGGQFATPFQLKPVRPAGVLGTQIIGTVRIADVNNDGNADVVFPVSYVNYSTNKSVIAVFTYLGDGRGGFASPVTSTIPLSSSVFVVGGHSVELADMAHTGKSALVLEVIYYNPSTGSYAVNVLSAKGNGDGTFGAVVSPGPPIPASNTTRGTLSVHDYDQDGNLDVLFADGVNNLELARGKGDGTLKPLSVALADIGPSSSLVTGDFNRDNILDVVAIQPGLALAFNGLGDGTFNYTPTGQYAGGLPGIQPLSAADFDGDGNLDFLWIEVFYNQAGIFFGNGDSTFRGTPAITAANPGPNSPNLSERATDFAVVAAAHYASKTRSDALVNAGDHLDYGIFQGNTGAMQMSVAFSAAALTDVDYVEQLGADLNGDGYADVVMATITGVKVALSNGDGTFAQAQRIKIPVQLGCVLGFGDAGDLNGDGKADLVFGYTGNAYCGASGASPSGYAVLLGDGKGGISSSTFVPYGNSTGIVRLADFNGDGIRDLVLLDSAYKKYSITILKGIGDGTFDVAHPITVYSSTAYPVTDIKALDMDGDSKADIVMSYYGATGTQGVLLAKGNGDLTFAAPTPVIAGATGQYLEVADFNGDGLPDVAATLLSTSTRTLHDIGVALNMGNDTFATPLIYVMPVDPLNNYNKNLFAGDYNSDGALDLLAGNGNFKVPGALFFSNAGSTWTLSAQPASPVTGSPVQMIAQGTTIASTLTGTVQFLSNSQLLGSAPVNNNSAVFTAPSLPVGTNTITAQYTGDGSHFATRFGSITLQVQAPSPSFTMTPAPALLAVVSGQSVASQVTVATNSGFQGTIAFTCSNLPVNAYCIVSPQSLTLGASSTQTVAVTIFTSDSAQMSLPGFFGPEGDITLASLAILPFAFRKRRLFGILACTMLFVSLSGCGGSSNSPRGTSFVTVTGTATLTSGAQITQAIAIPMKIN